MHIFGFGPNTYGNYEKGEIPSKSNARLIQMAKDPEELKKLALLSNALSKSLDIKINDVLEVKESMSLLNLSNLFKQESQDSFNGYKLFNEEKALHMILYLVEKLEPWKTKLNKLLFYSDFLYYKQYGSSMLGLKYAAIDYGPVPNEYELLFTIGRLKEIFKKSHVEINAEVSGEKILPMKDVVFKRDLFNNNEIEILNTIVNKFSKVTSKEIVKMSHQEKAWIDNYKKHPFINYNSSFDLIHA